MSGSGLSFTGDWEYDQGGCGSSCGWNGECKEGACLKNDDPAPASRPYAGGRSATHSSAAESATSGRCPSASGEHSGPEPRADEGHQPEGDELTAEEMLVAIRELLLEEEERMLGAMAIELRGGRGATPSAEAC